MEKFYTCGLEINIIKQAKNIVSAIEKFYTCGLEKDNLPKDTSDSGHPHLSGSQWKIRSQKCADENTRNTCHNLKTYK